MNSRSPARVVTALALAVGVALGATAGTAGASGPEADRPGEVAASTTPAPPPADASAPAVAVPAAPDGTGPAGAQPCPVADPTPPTNPGPFPTLEVTDPGPGATDPCPTAPAPTPAPEPSADAGAPPADQAGPHADAPTAALRTLATALRTTTSGVTAAVSAPAGLDVGQVEVSVLFGVTRRTVNYDRAAGSRIEFDYPHLDGALRTENLQISLRELSPGGRTYGVVSTVQVEPRFDVTISALRGFTQGRCDLFSPPDRTVLWVDPTGRQHVSVQDDYPDTYHQDLGAEGFGFTEKRVSIRRGLTTPGIQWFDRDPFGGKVGTSAVPRGAPLLPRAESPQGLIDTVVDVRVKIEELYGDDCESHFAYQVTYHPVVG